MKILLSPTKKMHSDRDSLAPIGLPCLLSRTEQILSQLRSMSPEELKALWGCNDAIARENLQRLQDMDLRKGLSPALLSYEGIAFRYMAPTVFSEKAITYVQEHLRILSGFYGVLRPLDGIRPYRLEMQARLSLGGSRDLYHFWGRDLYDRIRDDSGIFLNLASREYTKCIEPYLSPEDLMITCDFMEEVGGKLRQKATFAKMARGEMVRFLAESQAENPKAMQNFDRLGFSFQPDLSTEERYIFLRQPDSESDP